MKTSNLRLSAGMISLLAVPLMSVAGDHDEDDQGQDEERAPVVLHDDAELGQVAADGADHRALPGILTTCVVDPVMPPVLASGPTGIAMAGCFDTCTSTFQASAR